MTNLKEGSLTAVAGLVTHRDHALQAAVVAQALPPHLLTISSINYTIDSKYVSLHLGHLLDYMLHHPFSPPPLNDGHYKIFLKFSATFIY